MFPLEVCNRGTILIVGDLGDLELMMSCWMIEKRAVKRLVLMSQRTLNQLEQSKEWLQLKRVANEHNAYVNVTQADLTNFEQIHKLIEQLGQTSYTVRGIILSAIVAGNHTLSQLTEDDLTRAFTVKIRGAWHLHQASQLACAPLHFFVVFSSIRNHLCELATSTDNAGNQFLDALVLYRSRQLHLPALSVSLPVVSDMPTNDQKMQICEELTYTAMFELIERFHLNQTNCPCPIVFAVNWKKLEQTICKASSYQLFNLVKQRHNTVDLSITSSDNINGIDSINSPLETVVEQIQTAVARILGLADVNRISVHRSAISQGMDSLTVLALYNWLAREMNVFVPLVVLLQDAPIQSIAIYVYDKLKGQPISTAPHSNIH